MEISYVIERIKNIKSAGMDNMNCPSPHIMEDELFLDVLTAIANGAENAQALAREAIKSANLDITRWYE